jgi:hypothetical protein
MHREPAVRDRCFNRRAIFLVAATGTDELCVDHGDRQSPGMIGLHPIRQRKQFLLGGLGRRERSLSFWLHDRHAGGVGGASLAFRASGHVRPP